MNKPGFWTATISGLLLTFPLIALFFFGWRLLGFPFVPFDLFDSLSRVLPGAIITSSIEGMIAVIRTLHLGTTAVVAKSAEQGIAVILFLVLMALCSTLFLVLPRKPGARTGYLSGAALGMAIGLVLAFSIAAGRTARVSPSAGIVWTMVLMIAWGVSLAWLRGRFAQIMEPQPANARVEAMNRRQILIRLGGASAAITVFGAVVGGLERGGRVEKTSGSSTSKRWSGNHALPNADASVKPAPGTRPEFTPLESHYRIDINTVPPSIKEEAWRLQITGLVDHPMELALGDIRRFEPMHQFITLACISNLIAGDLIGTTRWTGVSMQTILEEARPRANATHLKIRSADDFYEIVALETIRQDARVMLAYEWDGVPLTPEHGFPLRIYIPDRYGMKQPKWIRSMEFIDHAEEGYWVKRGWDAEARMRATSAIDTMSSNMMIAERNASTLIPLGGIAHAGARGISMVQVQVDEEPWRDALLRTPLSKTTWVIWRYDWPFKAGKHTFKVRCFEGNGTAQITSEAPPHPSGATGLHSITTTL